VREVTEVSFLVGQEGLSGIRARVADDGISGVLALRPDLGPAEEYIDRPDPDSLLTAGDSVTATPPSGSAWRRGAWS
jgi:hypothetical protein